MILGTKFGRGMMRVGEVVRAAAAVEDSLWKGASELSVCQCREGVLS